MNSKLPPVAITEEKQCQYPIGSTISWQGQDGIKSGKLSRISRPENSDYVLWIDRGYGDDESLFPLHVSEVQACSLPPVAIKPETPQEPRMVKDSGGYLTALNTAAVGFDRAAFRSRFVGVLSCYVNREIWDYALKATKEQMVEEGKPMEVKG